MQINLQRYSSYFLHIFCLFMHLAFFMFCIYNKNDLKYTK